MSGQTPKSRRLVAALLVCAAAGCHTTQPIEPYCIPADVPRELDKASLPAYAVEPPDILVIEALRMVPRGPYRIEPLDTLVIQPADKWGNIYRLFRSSRCLIHCRRLIL